VLLFPWEISGNIVNITTWKESVFQKHPQLKTSELFVVLVGFFSFYFWTNPSFNVNSHRLFSFVTPAAASCCSEFAGTVICGLKFYPAVA